MSMQKTTCCLLLRLNHAMLPGKTNISGCCSSGARSCARWEWCIAIVMPLERSIPERIHVVQRLGRRAYHLHTVFVLSVPRVLAFFPLPPLSVCGSRVLPVIQSAAEQRFPVHSSAYPDFRIVFMLTSVEHDTKGAFTSLHLHHFDSLPQTALMIDFNVSSALFVWLGHDIWVAVLRCFPAWTW